MHNSNAAWTADTLFTAETTCRSCGSQSLSTIIEFGETTLADRLLREAHLHDTEPRAPLTLRFCSACSLVQIAETVDPRVLFFDEYPYFSSVSPSLLAHFRASALHLIEDRKLGPTTLVLEAASNDGYMLRNFVEHGIPVLGVDPAQAPVQAALAEGIPTRCTFFDRSYARQLVREGHRASVFLANNVLAHVPDLNGFVEGISTVLRDDGVAVIEVPYLVDLLDHCEFDTIYHQHLCYFSVAAVDRLFRRHGLFLNHLERLPVHGGSLRLFFEPVERVRPSVSELLKTEIERGVTTPEFYQDFATRVESVRSSLQSLLQDLKSQGKRIVGYGAAAKATTLMSFCGIDGSYLDYVADLSPYKQGRFMGGSRLRIVPPARILEDRPDYVLILPWNFSSEIRRQLSTYTEAGGRFIIPIPSPHVVGESVVAQAPTLGA